MQVTAAGGAREKISRACKAHSEDDIPTSKGGKQVS